MSRPARALIDLDALRHNYALARALAPASRNLAVIKANAYGHGATLVARALAPLAPAFGVACIEEALELREAGIDNPVLLMEGVYEAAEIAIAARHNFWQVIENESQLRWLLEARPGVALHVWLKIDSGMGRLGFRLGEARAVHARLAAAPQVHPEIVLATHLACADELDNDYTREQIARFREAVAGIQAPLSIANSPGLLGWPEARADWNRPGYMLYGASPFAVAHPAASSLAPVMTLQSAVISLHELQAGDAVGYGSTWTAARPSRIATVAIGYGDGYPRHARNGTPVLVNGRPAPLAGRVSMDMITVDVSDLPQTRLGDPVTLWGPGLPAATVAECCGTSGYELLTQLSARTPRVCVAGNTPRTPD